MLSIEKSSVPAKTLLAGYAGEGAYLDAYQTVVVGSVTLAEYMLAFYTTPLFRLERAIPAVTVSRPSTDEQAQQLADGRIHGFAAWTVEERKEREVLMCDFLGRTRSWLMVVPLDESASRLYFGSAVVPVRDPGTGKLTLGPVFRALLGFHRMYSVALLYSAARQIRRMRLETSPGITNQGVK